MSSVFDRGSLVISDDIRALFATLPMTSAEAAVQPFSEVLTPDPALTSLTSSPEMFGSLILSFLDANGDGELSLTDIAPLYADEAEPEEAAAVDDDGDDVIGIDSDGDGEEEMSIEVETDPETEMAGADECGCSDEVAEADDDMIAEAGAEEGDDETVASDDRGLVSIDLNGDGVPEVTIRPVTTQGVAAARPGMVSIDTNGDGCADVTIRLSAAGMGSLAIAIDGGDVTVDNDGDGVADFSFAGAAPSAGGGVLGLDSDGDGQAEFTLAIPAAAAEASDDASLVAEIEEEAEEDLVAEGDDDASLVAGVEDEADAGCGGAGDADMTAAEYEDEDGEAPLIAGLTPTQQGTASLYDLILGIIDANRDGLLTQSELIDMLAAADANRDGEITAAEIGALAVDRLNIA